MKYRLLVVDDNKMMRHFLVHLFGKKNDVVAVESAEEAISWLNSHDLPDLIIADYNLEGISGFDLLERPQNAGGVSGTAHHHPFGQWTK